MFDTLVPAAEKLALAQLRAEAAKLSPGAEKLVAEKGRWNPVAVAALQEGGAQVSAKYLNRTGVSAEYAPEVQFLTALGSVVAGHFMLLEELKTLAVEKLQAIEVESTVKKELHDQENKNRPA